MRFIKRLSTTFYADEGISFLDLRFENDVKMYGTQAAMEHYAIEISLRMM